MVRTATRSFGLSGGNPNCGEKISVPVGGKQLVILNSELRFRWAFPRR